MSRDEDLRRMAEDLRALGRSLARDLREAAEEAVRSGVSPGPVLRDMAADARRAMHPPPGSPPDPARPGDDGPGRRGPSTGPRNPPRPGWQRPRSGPGGSGPGPWGCSPPYGWPGPRCRRRRGRGPLPPVRRRWDARAVAAAIVVVLAASWLLGLLHALDVPFEAGLAVGLMMLGAAVLVTARTDWSLSRRSWPVWLGAAMILVLIIASSGIGVGPALRHVSFGDVRAVAGPDRTVYGGFGDLTVDATHVPAGATVEVESVAGDTVVIPPPGAALDVHARVLGGEICVMGARVATGANATYDARLTGVGAPGAGTPLVLHIRQVAGQLDVGGAGCRRR